LNWTIVLIVEDDSDGRALAALTSRSQISSRVDWLPAGGIGDIKRRAEQLIELAKDRITSTTGCVAVLVDRDGKDPLRDEPHRTIAAACRRTGVEFLAAREALEAWFLADEGICSWLGVRARATTDRIGDPKAVVAKAFLKKTGRPYRQRRSRVETVRHASGIQWSRNESANRARRLAQACSLPSR
jgi:hypothetical protein